MDTTATFSACSNRYIKYILGSRDTDQTNEIRYMTYWSTVFGDTKVSSLERYHVAVARDGLLAVIQANLEESGRKGTGYVSVNRYMARLRHFFNTCADWGLRSEVNPCTRIKPYKESKGKLVTLTTAEILRLLDECGNSKNKELYLAILMILSSGARKNEVLNLTYDQIDYDQSSAILETSKNGDRASLYFNDEAMRILKSHRRTQGEIFKKKNIEKGFQMAALRAGIEGISLHGLRHIYASSLASSGMSLPFLQDALRLKSVNLVRRYAHLSPRVIHSQVLGLTNKWKVKLEDVGMDKDSFPMTAEEFNQRRYG